MDYFSSNLLLRSVSKGRGIDPPTLSLLHSEQLETITHYLFLKKQQVKVEVLGARNHVLANILSKKPLHQNAKYAGNPLIRDTFGGRELWER